MGAITTGYSWSSGEVVTAAKLNAMLADATITGGSITLNDISTALRNTIWPVGSLWLSADAAVTPSSLSLPGTWSLVAQGRNLVGYDSGDTEYDAIGDSDTEPSSTWGSANTATIAEANLPAHTHSVSLTGTTGSDGAHTHDIRVDANGSGTGSTGQYVHPNPTGGTMNSIAIQSAGDHTHSVSLSGTSGSTGSGTAFDVRTKSYIVAVWKRDT